MRLLLLAGAVAVALLLATPALAQVTPTADELVDVPFQTPGGGAGTIQLPADQVQNNTTAADNRDRLIQMETRQQRLLTDVAELNATVKDIERTTRSLPNYVTFAVIALGLFDIIVKKFVTGRAVPIDADHERPGHSPPGL